VIAVASGRYADTEIYGTGRSTISVEGASFQGGTPAFRRQAVSKFFHPSRHTDSVKP